MTRNSLLGRTALGSAAFLFSAFAFASPAMAQVATTPTPPPQTADEEEEEQLSASADGSQPEEQEGEQTIVVTGSLIPRPQFEGTIPGAQVTQEQIETRAFTNALDVLNDIPLVGPGASPFGTNGGQPASLGAAFVDLLDLGTNRTLTLVNGRRFVSGNAATLFVAGNTTGSQVDLNVIPTALVARFDVLTVGGAVVYGSDAIAGVVNAILRTDYEGVQLSGLAGVNEEGDGAAYRLTALAGTNFADDRGNVAVSFEYNRDDALFGDQRREIALNPVAPTFFGNGGVRNTDFQATIGLPGGGAFLPAASDLVPNNVAGPGFIGGSILISNGGSIFASNANVGLLPPGFQGLATTLPQDPNNPNVPNRFSPNFRPQVLAFQAGNVNLVPGTPVGFGNGCSPANPNFCNFAPLSLPGSAAGQATFANNVIARFAPSQAGQGTQAQRNALALQLLQANLPTPREFLAANPNTNINAFIGTFIPNFLDVANPDPATRGVLPRIAVPLQFDASGNVIQIIPAVISDPRATPSTTGGAVGGTGFFNNNRLVNLRVQQDRYIANFIGSFELTDWLTLYTENLYARVDNVSPRNFASSNTIGSSTAENAVLLLNINNPFLDEADRANLRAAGVTGPFFLSRSNQDIVGDNPAAVSSDTYRTVVGARGDFGLFGRSLRYDASFTYGRADASGASFQINDIEYALALDAVDEGLARRGVANGNIVCRAQINPSAVIGTTPPGVVGREVVREVGPDGILTERFLRRTVTAEQVAACRPLNVFGVNQFSEDARQYVLARTGFTNESEQYFARASVAGSLFDLPAGELGFGLVGEYRRETLAYAPTENSRIGATRTAALASTSGFIEAIEIGGELRIPIFGDDFNIPVFRNLDFTPGIRFVRQNGDSPDVRLLSGQLVTNQSEGDWEEIYSLAGSWRPIRDITIRANYTRSIRQPSIVELFLGNQPAFVGITDPCANANISGGVRPDVRRANCVQAVINAGLATDAASATTFLNNYVPSGTAINGFFSGSPGLLPERGESFTVGGVLAPRFLPGFQFSADYINVTLRNQIIPTTITTALNVCFDSPNFPDTSPEVGVNTCTFFQRLGPGSERPFEVDNNFTSGFINLGALKVRAINFTGQYRTGLDGLFGPESGELELYANVYWLMDYLNSPSGNFDDTQPTDGTLSRPEIEAQVRARYENDNFYFQWTAFWQPETQIFSNGRPITIEVQDLLDYPAFSLHDATIGFRVGEDRRLGFQFTVNNVFDNRFLGDPLRATALSGTLDDFGRRYRVSVNVRF